MLDSAEFELKIVDAVYRGAYDPAELHRGIVLIAEYFGTSDAVLGEVDTTTPEAQISLGAGTVNEDFMREYAPYADLDPAPAKFAALATGIASTTDRLFSAEFLNTNVFLNEFLRPRGIEGTLGAPLLSSGGRFALVGLFQRSRSNPFGGVEIARLERLTPHLTRALQIRRLFLQNEARLEALEAIVNRNVTGMIGQASGGRVLFVNDAARAMAAACDGFSLNRDGRLMTPDRSAAKRLATLESDVKRGGAGGLVRIQRPSGRVAYVVLVSPLPSGGQILTRARGGVLFAIHDPNRRALSTVDHIAQMLHVPLGAAKVLEAMLEGTDLKDYAERESISINTVKFHLKTAFDRTGSRSQADLVRRALSVLKDLEPYFSGRDGFGRAKSS
jgi:Bacterial regulatory proteins, luxR family